MNQGYQPVVTTCQAFWGEFFSFRQKWFPSEIIRYRLGYLGTGEIPSIFRPQIWWTQSMYRGGKSVRIRKSADFHDSIREDLFRRR